MNTASFRFLKNAAVWRKTSIVLFIIFFLRCEVLLNLHVEVPMLSSGPEWLISINKGIQEFYYQWWKLGVLLCISEHWTMYSSLENVSNAYLVFGVNEQGKGFLLPIPGQTSRSFWEANFFDYHEPKLLEGVNSFPEFRDLFFSYLCRTYGKAYNLKSIVFVRVARTILPPEQAAKAHSYYHPQIQEGKIDEKPCVE